MNRSDSDRDPAIREHEINIAELELENELYRRAEVALKEAHQESLILYDLAPVGYFILGREGTIRRANCQGAHDLGRDEVDLVGKRFEDYVSDSSRELFRLHLAAVLRNKQDECCDLQIRGKDDRLVWVRVRSRIAPATRHADEGVFLTGDLIDDLLRRPSDSLPSASRERGEMNLDQNEKPRSGEGPLGRIMVVDDEELVLKATARLLGRLGYDVIGHTSPEEALQKFGLDPAAYDAVISDFRMPSMNGLQLAEEFLALQPELPIMLVSGYTGDIDPDRAKRIGIDSLRSKPVSAQDLSGWLASVIGAGLDPEGASHP